MKNKQVETEFTCISCGTSFKANRYNCPQCGEPVPVKKPGQGNRKFIFFFIVIVIICAVTIVWLPPNWSNFR